LIQTYVERHFRQPKDFPSFVYVSQVLQAEGDKIAMEAHRRSMPFCMGTMYWQIDDCWPVASWSSIDYYGNWKALHYYVSREYRTFLISQMLKDDSLEFYVVSDSLAVVPAEFDIKVIDFGGKVISSMSFPVTVDPDSSRIYAKVAVADLVKGADESKIVLMSRLVLGDRLLTDNTYLFKEPKDLDLQKPSISVTASKNDEGYEVSLTADTFAKDVYLTFDNHTGFFTDNYFDLFPGETKTVGFRTKEEIGDAVKDLKVMSLVDSY
ncbi:MAG: hypothetical protein B7Z63_04750, partial [Ignavibacteriae bacterium 37-53-5]